MKYEQRRHLLTTINLILTALILLGVIVTAGWLMMLNREINTLRVEAGEMAVQLTLQSTLEAYEEEIAAEGLTEEGGAPSDEAEAPTDAPEATRTPSPTAREEETASADYSEIELFLSPELNELSDQRFFRLPPLSMNFPEGWGFLFDSNGKLTVIDAAGEESAMEIIAKNTRREFLLNEIGSFQLLADGSLSWFADTTPRQGLGAGDYEIWFNVGDYTSSPITITVDDAPMSRILQSVAMYRTFEDLEADNRYLSFDSYQEPMSMYGYTVMEDGTLFIRVWRSHDKFYYWIKGDFVMHPDRGILYNDLEDLKDETGAVIIPEIHHPEE